MPSRSPQESPSGTEHEVAEQIEAELERLSVGDVLLHAASTVATLAYRRLAPGDRDLEQVRLAIATLQALLPLLDDGAPAEVRRDFRAAIANLQIAYADAVSPVQ
jgi:hypothetical protein